MLCLLAMQGLRRLEMTDLKGMPSETDAFLRSLSGLTCLRVSFTSPCTKLPPMHCLSDLVSLKVRQCPLSHPTVAVPLHVAHHVKDPVMFSDKSSCRGGLVICMPTWTSQVG